MTSYIGEVYTWGDFTYRAHDYLSQNNPWDWSDENCIVYTDVDISDVLSVKKLGDPDNTDTGDDIEFANNNGPTDTQKMRMIARLTGTTSPYSSAQPAKTYDELYTSGVYTGGTYEDADISMTESGLWPFSKVPKFNLDLDGTIISGVYWTDGTTYITSFAEFRNKVLGDYDADLDADNNMLVENEKYSRTRLIKQYKAGYDFRFISPDMYDTTLKYQTAKDEFNEVWSRYYPTITSPLDYFDSLETFEDTTYLTFNDTETEVDVKPTISYVEPGVYIKDNFAVPYDTDTGLIIYNDMSLYQLTPFINHHDKNVLNEYHVDATHNPGKITVGSTDIELPFYFGTAVTQNLVLGVNTPYRFTQMTVNSPMESAALSMAVNLIQSPAPSNWLAQAEIGIEKVSSLSAKGGTYIRTFQLNSDIERISDVYITGSINDGLKCGVALKGHTATRLKYPVMLGQTHINDDNAFILERVDTADLTNRGLLYVDRDDTDISMHLFNVVEATKQPDDLQGGGTYTVTLKSVNGGSLYFAKKQTNSSMQEIVYDFYIPGIAYGSTGSNEGHMQPVDDMPNLELSWTPVILKIPTSAIIKFSNNNSLNTAHKFFTEGTSVFRTASLDIGELDAETLEVPLTLNVNNVAVSLIYHADTGVTELGEPGPIVIIDSANDTASILNCVGLNEQVSLELYLQLFFMNNHAKFYMLPDTDYTLLNADSYKVDVEHSGTDIVYDTLTQSVIRPRADAQVKLIDNGQHITVDVAKQVTLNAALRTITGTVVTFTFRGKEYSFDLSEAKQSTIQVISTDIRKPDKTKFIGKIIPDNEYQLLRQQWNTTVEVENYWWIDATHVLELNKTDFVLKRNTKELDDWNGNRFEEIYKKTRSDILTSNVYRYFVPNVYNTNTSAVFATIQESEGYILITLYDTRKLLRKISDFRVRVFQKELGQVLNDYTIDNGVALLNTYNPLTADQIISKAIWSATITDDRLIIGCHLGNNYDQWTVVYNLDNLSVEKVIQGYGFVGVHGDLTGGMLPNDYMDADRGFNDAVQPLSVLGNHDRDLNNIDAMNEVGSLGSINDIKPRVVGTTEQQWYIQLKLYGIVSHLVYTKDGVFEKKIIPMTNNYISMYKSPSFSSSVLGDAGVQATTFESLFKFPEAIQPAWTAFMALLGMPMLYSFAPRYAYLAYLQQSFGQYAYVHYNSSKSMPEQDKLNSNTDSGMNENQAKQTQPLLSSAYTFDMQKFSQKASASLDYFMSGMFGILIAAFSDSLQVLDKKMSMNEEQNQTAVSDVGRKFVDNAVSNVNYMLASAIMTQSKNDTGITSVVSGVKNLDMFYSTSDQQHIQAGPGFVEHQFVADCVAQSSTDTQAEGKVQQFFFCIRALTTLQITLTIKLEEIIADGMDKAADATAAQMVCGTSLGAVAVAMHAVAQGLRAAIAAQENALVQLEKILDVVCQRGMVNTVDGVVTRHALSVEGQHKYGEKNEVFMWPCWGIQPGQLKYTDEWVNCGVKNTPWKLTLWASKYYQGGGVSNIFNLWLAHNIPPYSSC